jgi:hypothetical protein
MGWSRVIKCGRRLTKSNDFKAIKAVRLCSLAVEHSLSKREVVGSNPAIGFFLEDFLR